MTNKLKEMDGTASRDVSRRSFLKRSVALAGLASLSAGSVFRPTWSHAAGPIKIGIATDITGPMAAFGNSNWQAAQFTVKLINDAGGILGRPLELHLEDTASDPAKAVVNVQRLIQQNHVDLVIGGILSSTREAIKTPILKRGKTLYIYPEIYEGGDCTPHLYCVGLTPTQQLTNFIPWLIKQGAKRFAMPAADYQWPHVTNKIARQLIEANGGEVIFEEYYPLDQVEYSSTIAKIASEKVDHVFNTIVPPGLQGFTKQLYESGFQKNGGTQSCIYLDENAQNFVPKNALEGIYSVTDFFHTVEDPFSQKLLADYNAMFPGTPYLFAAGTGATGIYRAIKLYEQSVIKTNGDLAMEAVSAVLDSAKISEGPGGPAAIIPGTHHAAMNVYVAQAKGPKWEVISKTDMVPPAAC
ncbi:substrate-binding protein [Mesorhizobium sp. CO1-1-8]|uniref:substrate-binding protein n=1 Tax=Mesorhizobium sp. CO1-1-8 TaxID=2876631 RepID=UPI001CD0EBEC|nr:substrate-binding protein [Mesorhizobium sp. CO1-1-8]MBZ9772571.1 substrate-binding protein [Mesorhizobium sp. CO1-1-8]